MTDDGPLRVATRGSELALRQARAVKRELERRRQPVEVVEVETRGDRLREELIHRLGRTGAFVRALDERVLDGDVDAAVHSMKDVPTDNPPELAVAAVPERAAAGDVLVTPDGAALADLPEGARVGTASLRRTAQLLAERPDLEVAPLRGNVDTRVEKLLAPWLQREHERLLESAGGLDDGTSGTGGDGGHDAGPDDRPSPEAWFEERTELERRALGRAVDEEFDAIVLAAAGLERMGLLEELPARELPGFVPSPGQGALAVTASEPAVVGTLRETLDHPRSRVATTVERTVLAELGGGCVAPIGVHAAVRGRYVHTRVHVSDRAGKETVTATRDLPIDDHAAAAVDLASELAAEGADDLITAARRDENEGGAGRMPTGSDDGGDVS